MRLKVGALIVKGGDLYVIIIEFCFILFHCAGLTFSSFFSPVGFVTVPLDKSNSGSRRVVSQREPRVIFQSRRISREFRVIYLGEICIRAITGMLIKGSSFCFR